MTKFQEPATLKDVSVDLMEEEQGCPGPAQEKPEGAVTARPQELGGNLKENSVESLWNKGLWDLSHT